MAKKQNHNPFLYIFVIILIIILVFFIFPPIKCEKLKLEAVVPFIQHHQQQQERLEQEQEQQPETSYISYPDVQSDIKQPSATMTTTNYDCLCSSKTTNDKIPFNVQLLSAPAKAPAAPAAPAQPGKQPQQPSGGGGDQTDQALYYINKFRSQINVPPLTRATPQQIACVQNSANRDSTSGFHNSFGQCQERSQCECGSGTRGQDQCVQMYINEGPGGGHYRIIADPSFKSLASASTSSGFITHNFY